MGIFTFMDKLLKIGLVGSAGLGKSTIAEELANRLGTAFLRSKDITRPILKKYDYVYGEGNYVELFLARKEIEFELVDERIYTENLLSGGFITDRTTLECFCYALLKVEKYLDDEIKLLERRCRENMAKYTHLFYFPCDNGWLDDNGLRTTSVFFQWKIDLLIRGVLHDWKIPCSVCPKDAPVDFIMGELVK